MDWTEKYDSAFLGILQNEGNLTGFLDALFSFLYRKTDFYLPLSEKMGFPPGAAYKLLSQVYKKYETIATMRLEKATKTQQKKVVDMEEECPVVREEEVTSTLSAHAHAQHTEATPTTHAQHMQATPTTTTATHGLERAPAKTSQSTAPSGPVNTDTVHTNSKTKPDDSTGSNDTKGAREGGRSAAAGEEEDDNPELSRLQKEFQANPESYNGAMRDNYSWSQSISDVDVVVKVPANVRKGADVRVEISRRRLRVEHRSQDAWTLLADGALTWDVHKDECLWSLEPGRSININLEKVQERWWEALLEGEDKISVRKIDPTRPITDLDDESQAKIEEMMFNEQQKKLGRPQSHELKVQDMLKHAWDAEGSPFKGQPFDPSKVSVANQGAGFPLPPQQ